MGRVAPALEQWDTCSQGKAAAVLFHRSAGVVLNETWWKWLQRERLDFEPVDLLALPSDLGPHNTPSQILHDLTTVEELAYH